MPSLSNLYASQIFSEHPVFLYPLDDDTHYISLISQNKRFFDSGNWTDSFDNVALSDNPTVPDLPSPFKDDTYSGIVGDIPGEGSGETIYEIKSPELFQLQDLNEDLATFSFAMFLYQSSFFVNWYEFGYSYYDTFLEEEKEVVYRIDAKQGREWINFDFSFLPHEYDNSQIKIVLRISVSEGGDAEDYSFVVNGISVGQWSEGFSTQSLGAYSENYEDLFVGVPALEYGIQEDSGYYLVEDNALLAKNQGLPLVYGSKYSTKIYPSNIENNPSIVFPGNGFLNDSGKQNNYTLEFWMNINPNLDKEKRICGPIASTDGIYVKEGIISLSIGSEFGSYYVSEWYRPMLVHLSLSEDEASLLVNGEKIIAIPYDRDSISFPSDLDWLGFYSYENIDFFAIDCISLFPYNIPEDVAKRRFVYGQGTPSPENVAESFDGFNSYVNFSNANYGVNKIYPDLAVWNAGYNNNLNVTRTSIGVPEYELPEIFIGGRRVEDLYADNKLVCEIEDDLFFTFRPNISEGEYTPIGNKWNETGYLFFNSLGIIDDFSGMYGVFAAKNIDSKSILASITNSVSEDVFEIYLENKKIYYSFNNNILVSNEIYDEEITTGYNYYHSYDYFYDQNDEEFLFAFGINVKSLSNTFGYQIKKFFQSPDNLQAYFGGNGETTFNEKIYSIGFFNSLNYQEIKESFFEDGTTDNFEYDTFIDHVATYTLSPFIRFNHFFLDISISGLWEEYFPLSSFASFVDNYDGEKFYDLDFLQINLGYPSVAEVVEKLRSQFGWNYAELFLEFNSPSQKSYSILDNSSLSGYSIYDDLVTRNVIERFFDTENASLKTFLTFQLLSDGANRPLEDFPFTRELVDTKYIDPNLEFSQAQPNRPILTKYEFLDKTVVYPPRGIDFNRLAIVFHFIMKQKGILSNPLVVRDFEIVSRALNHNEFTAIGSESGFPFYSYVKAGIYFENKTQNPVRISKKRYPYLYLTEDAGLSVLGNPTFSKEHGIAMPINEGKANQYVVSAIQSWLKYDLDSFSTIAYPIFEIQSLEKTVEVLIRSDASGQRGVITARDKRTREIEENVTFYQNGIRVKNPIVEKGEWFSLGILFDEELVFNNFTGYINFFRGITFNNVSNYRPSGLGKTLEIIARPWRRVLTSNDIDNFKWSVWYVTDNVATKTRTNLCYNPGIEIDTFGWEAAGAGTTIEKTDDAFRFGSSSLKCTTSTANNSGAVFGNESGERIPISPNTEYTVSLYVKVPSGSPNKLIRLRNRQYSAVTGGGIVNIQNYPAVGITSQDGWARYFFTFTSVSSANAFSFEVSQEANNEEGSIFYVDGALVEETATLVPKLNRYFDGDLSAAGLLAEQLVWTGQEHASTSIVTYFEPQSNQIRQWNSVYAIDEQTIFSLNPRDIYRSFIGTNGVVIDDNDVVSIDSDALTTFSSINWLRLSDKPA